MARSLTRLLVLLLSFALGVSGLRADFFWRIPRQADPLLTSMGGSRLYATEVELNGAPGTLQVFAFSGVRAPDLSRRVSARMKLPPASRRPGGSLMSYRENGRETHLLVLPSPGGRDRCVVLAFEAESAARAGGVPGWPDDLPPLDAATPTFSAVCKLTRTSFVTAETSSSPEAALAGAGATLLRQGWKEASPPAASCKIFTDKHKHCLVFASADPRTGRTTISLLQRKGSGFSH